MPRREILTAAERLALFAIPEDEGELIRVYTLSKADRTFIQQHRGDPNRLGIAIQMSYLQHPGRVLGEKEKPNTRLLHFVATQLGVAPDVWMRYAARDETRREHVAELLLCLGLEPFTAEHARAVVSWLEPAAAQTTRGLVLAQTLIAELRKRRIVLPPMAVIERLCAEAATRAQRTVFARLTDGLDTERRRELDRLLDLRDDSPYSILAWLRTPPGPPTARAIVTHIKRLHTIRAIGLAPEAGFRIHQSRSLKIAREAGQTAVYQLKEYEPARRHGTLVALLLETSATLTDEIFDLHDRLIGSFFTKSKRKYEYTFAEQGRAINDKVRLYAKIGAALMAARDQGQDAYQAIETVLSWDLFSQSVKDAERLARAEHFDPLEMLTDHYATLRRYSPMLLETFDFKAAPAAAALLHAVQTLRHLNRDGVRKLPTDAPTGFIRPRWSQYVIGPEGLDRRFYEFCVMVELKNALRSGDVSVAGSRQFRAFDDYLIPRPEFQQSLKERTLPAAIPTTATAYLRERLSVLRAMLDQTDTLARKGLLPDVELNPGLKISPLESATPKEADALRDRLYRMLPPVKITDLLLEVDRWTGFSRRFTHLKTGEPVKDPILLLTAILADGTNLGLDKMAASCPGTSPSQLSWMVAWHIRDDTYTKALACLVNYHHRLPFAAHWGEGTTSSSDGQRYRAGGRGEAAGRVNAKYGYDPGVTFYTHVSDRYAPYHTKVIAATVRDATHVLDGLLYHESDLRIAEHYTDTAGFTDHVFALCHLLGFSFAPRIRDLADKRLYVPGKASQWPALNSLIGPSIRNALIEQQFTEVVRLVASIQQGTVTVSLILRKLGAYPRQNGLAMALRELGRIERTLFMLTWLQDPALRRRVTAGLNKGEARHSLARAVFFNRLGEVRDRSFENQHHRASGLNLLVAAITLWNTVYLERAVTRLQKSLTVETALLQHVSPLGWEHIGLTGDYLWRIDKRVSKGHFRPLRTPGSRPADA